MKKTTFASSKNRIIMAKENANIKGDERLEAVESTLTKSELFIEKNQKTIIIVVCVIIAIVLGYMAYTKFYMEPRNKEAQAQIFMAEQYFESDSLNKALNGDGNNLGFLDVISEYGNTKSGNLACYYAGICYLKLGQFEDAIHYLNKFDSDDHIVGPMAIGATADANLELNNIEKAAELYVKAANKSKNEFTTPFFLMRAGNTYELAGNFKKALSLYEEIKANYFTTTEGRNVERYIAAVKEKIK